MILIFTEALYNTGLGHLGRCTALAEILMEKSATVQLIVNSDSTFPNWNFPYNVVHTNWLNGKELDQLWKSTEFNIEKEVIIIYIDSYLATLDVYHSLKGRCNEFICIDDEYRLEYPTGSTILNPGYPGLFIEYDTTKYKVITGKEQVLLRKPFREKFAIPQINKPIQKILVTLGGADPNLYSEKFLKILVEHFPALEKHLVIGNGFSNSETLQQMGDDNSKFHMNLSALEMRNLMLQMDFAITAGGQTTYELDRCHVPMVIFKTAENQSGNIRGFVEYQGVREIKEPGDIISVLQEIERVYSITQ
jgi:UDP-2,4-diacetamido-2,4,6-trideoxy-beta-L-altropyranose hydrolase